MKICYITAQVPWGRGETFILEEMLEIKRQGINLLIIPSYPSKEVYHKGAEKLLNDAVHLPLMNFKIIYNFLKALCTKTIIRKVFLRILIHSRNPLVFFKNLAFLPKSVFAAQIVKQKNIQHIHAHWGSIPATVAFIISQITDIPWSMTLHRSDIKGNNMLKEKVRSAESARCISEHGEKELLKVVGWIYKEKIKVIHLGIKLSEKIDFSFKKGRPFTIIVPASFEEVKGHKYLIEALSVLVKKGIKNFQCFFYGEGPLRIKLENLIKDKGLNDYIKIKGFIPNEEIIEIYKNKKADLVVLSSIHTKDNEHEGIPVSLMEAMAYGAPVISTNTGGISELLDEDAGIMVEEKSSEQLAEAILKAMTNKELLIELSKRGYQKIKEKFNIEKNALALLSVILENK